MLFRDILFYCYLKGCGVVAPFLCSCIIYSYEIVVCFALLGSLVGICKLCCCAELCLVAVLGISTVNCVLISACNGFPAELYILSAYLCFGNRCLSVGFLYVKILRVGISAPFFRSTVIRLYKIVVLCAYGNGLVCCFKGCCCLYESFLACFGGRTVKTIF